MYLLLIRFEIPKNKLLEFNMAYAWVASWPVYALYPETVDTSTRAFEIIKHWNTEEEKTRDMEGHEFENLLGTIRVLGQIDESSLYRIEGEKTKV